MPADNHSPGAQEAKGSLFIDLMVSHSEPGVQDQWVRGLGAVERETLARFQKLLLECDDAQQDRIMQAMAGNKDKPTTELERFFEILKSRTFVGCTHPEHGA